MAKPKKDLKKYKKPRIKSSEVRLISFYGERSTRNLVESEYLLAIGESGF
jgi:hypothetical protein